ncbi:hypothetical protein [Flammeovirga aprica]|uniref:Uncharacterized protein n=1 Tax=Flammeovirga aprica JL-4 TaxID=694437 RepID=A0A7X9XAU0_9BACT|nr:hypothetical protein [Flammeovirga aprica]NME70032.1 hypothetical protein [Flammeovirga aprica JL-4]
MKKATPKRSFVEAFQIALINHSLFDQELFEENYQTLYQKIESSLQSSVKSETSLLFKTLNSSISKS